MQGRSSLAMQESFERCAEHRGLASSSGHCASLLSMPTICQIHTSLDTVAAPVRNRMALWISAEAWRCHSSLPMPQVAEQCVR